MWIIKVFYYFFVKLFDRKFNKICNMIILHHIYKKRSYSVYEKCNSKIYIYLLNEKNIYKIKDYFNLLGYYCIINKDGNCFNLKIFDKYI